MTKRFGKLAFCLAALCALPFAAHAKAYHVILCGSGGEEEFQKKFADWGMRYRAVLINNISVPEERVHLLMETPPEGHQGISTVELGDIENLFQNLQQTLTENDDLYLYFIGHGSYLRREAKFHIPGPDLTGERLKQWVDAITMRNLIVLNTTSSGAAFINVLSGPNRVIATATKGVEEINATEFMEHFITALEEGSADLNHDERISFLEACEQATALTEAWYKAEGYIATEHAILDDNGDGLGSRLPLVAVTPDTELEQQPPVFDGVLARECFIQDFSFPAGVPQEWIDTYLGTMDKIQALKRDKATLGEGTYYAELETLLVEAALTNRKIRAYNKPPKEDP